MAFGARDALGAGTPSAFLFPPSASAPPTPAETAPVGLRRCGRRMRLPLTGLGPRGAVGARTARAASTAQLSAPRNSARQCTCQGRPSRGGFEAPPRVLGARHTARGAGSGRGAGPRTSPRPGAGPGRAARAGPARRAEAPARRPEASARAARHAPAAAGQGAARVPGGRERRLRASSARSRTGSRARAAAPAAPAGPAPAGGAPGAARERFRARRGPPRVAKRARSKLCGRRATPSARALALKLGDDLELCLRFRRSAGAQGGGRAGGEKRARTEWHRLKGPCDIIVS